ncbi:unnamed protein product [Microthlaspi erraticum]|uniref:MATH domain-containing protein n=1 Tax=Microthlaspi erraticum TaxID=1685480 RepID=A0A6D2JJ02_9BRAS|nr:unnamed protein product [Microthlaspi erraticum]
MEDQKQSSFMFEIDNFSEKEAVIQSPTFSSGGCEWFVEVYPKGDNVDDHLSLYLCVPNLESLRLGWKRRASYSFALLNHSGEKVYRITCDVPSHLFCNQFSEWGWAEAAPLKILQEKGFLEKNKLIVKVEVEVLEVVDEEDVTGNETLDLYGFQVPYSQVVTVSNLFVKHPDVAASFKPKDQLVKTAYMNQLLGLMETLNKPQQSITDTELSNAGSELVKLTETAGFKLDWLKTKLDELSLERKKASFDAMYASLSARLLVMEKTLSEIKRFKEMQKKRKRN